MGLETVLALVIGSTNIPRISQDQGKKLWCFLLWVDARLALGNRETSIILIERLKSPLSDTGFFFGELAVSTRAATPRRAAGIRVTATAPWTGVSRSL